MVAGGNKYYYHTDNQYTPYAVTDSNNALVEKYVCDAYGKVSIFSPTNQVRASSAIGNPWGFTGRRNDVETGLMYYRNRTFSPDLGRFISRDPMGLDGGTNLYEYCGGNPVLYRDPTGLKIVVPAGSQKILSHLDALCPEGKPWTVINGSVQPGVKGFCKCTDKLQTHKIACSLICDLIESSTVTKIYTSNKAGGQTYFPGETVPNVGVVPEGEVAIIAGPARAIEGQKVTSDEWVPMHEMIGHVWPRLAAAGGEFTGNELIKPPANTPFQYPAGTELVPLAVHLENLARSEAGIPARSGAEHPPLGFNAPPKTGKPQVTPPLWPYTCTIGQTCPGGQPISWDQFVPGSFPIVDRLLPRYDGTKESIRARPKR
jgi:RHS repeat-associated protein